MTPSLDRRCPQVERVAVATGAGRGIGQAIAVSLAAAGYQVLVCDVDSGALRTTVDLCGPGHHGNTRPSQRGKYR
ncbi:SDR family NAD(P)-dependent oxidoreductase [Streptomyces lavendofoliae]|uniref:SDR family NAD(P)-dependent oxidoreductase n=1 Tax=Streptomyces lavendofoliae TaxID=67314 RepID=UPI003D9397F1